MHSCRDKAKDYAHMTKPDDSCIHFTQDNTRALFKEQYQNSFIDYIDQESKSDGLAVIYENPTLMCEGEQPYSIKINLYCDPSKSIPSFKVEAKSAIKDKCQMEVDM